MGGRGGSLKSSPQRAALNVNPPAAQAAVDVTKLNSLSDAELAKTLKSAFKAPHDSNQQNTDTQRFFNAIGWADNTPRVLDEKHFEGARKAIGATTIYHTDAPVYQIPDATAFANQYLGAGRQYFSGGVHGDGAYFATDARNSWGYGDGTSNSTQYKAYLSSRAKVINKSVLLNQFQSWGASHPQAYNAMYNSSQGYHKTGGSNRGVLSVFAAMMGYNVIQAGNYYTVLDRSATTVCKTIRRGGSGSDNW